MVKRTVDRLQCRLFADLKEIMSINTCPREPELGWAKFRRNCLTIFLSGLAIAFSISCPVLAQPSIDACGPIQNDYGPFDYRTQRESLKVVEQYHFTPRV